MLQEQERRKQTIEKVCAEYNSTLYYENIPFQDFGVGIIYVPEWNMLHCRNNKAGTPRARINFDKILGLR